MRVEKPRFRENNGELEGCRDCPLDTDGVSIKGCRKWWYRNGLVDDMVCPTPATYQEACRLAEQAEKGEKE